MRSSTLPRYGSMPLLAAFISFSLPVAGQEKPANPATVPAQSQPNAAATPPVSAGVLETVPTRIAKFEKDLTEKIDAARTVLDREVAEKRLTESVAQTLRWSLRTSSIAFSGTDIRGVLATARVPFENEAVTKACKDLEATWVTIQAEYGDLQKAALAEARKRAVDLIKTGRNAEQIDEFVSVLESAQTGLQRRFAGATGTDPAQAISGMLTAMRSLRRLVEAEASGNIRAIGTAVNASQTYGMDSQGGIDAEMKMRFERAKAPFIAKVDQAQDAIDAALEARKSSEEVVKLLAVYSDATQEANLLRTNFDYNQNRDYTASLTAYRSAIAILSAIEEKDYATALQQIRSGNLSGDGIRASKVAPLVKRWQSELEAEQAKTLKDQSASWRTRITNAKGPAEIEEIAREVQVVEQMPRDESRRASSPVPFGLSQTLSTLAVAWRSASPALLRENRVQLAESGRGESFATELSTLRRRIERDVISRTLKAPELNQPPLADKEPAEAIEALSDQLAAKKEWRRLIEVRQAWQQTSATDGYGRVGDDLITALRSFLAGQNFELAEQWRDAATAYKQVLLSTSARAPVADAAERLKALKKDHPEVMNAPAPQRGAAREALEE